MGSRIPKIPPRQVAQPLSVLNDNTLSQSRKRKTSGSDSAEIPIAKKRVSGENIQRNPEDPDWKALSEESGLSLADCLGLRLSFPKRSDAKAKFDAAVAHIRKLRAAGWYLYDRNETIAKDLQEATEQLVKERAERVEEVESAERRLQCAQKESEYASSEVKRLQSEIGDMKVSFDGAQAECQALQEAVQCERSRAEKLEKRVEDLKKNYEEASERSKDVAEKLAEAQKYAASLQHYNERVQNDLALSQDAVTKALEEKTLLTEEAATLRGKVAALEAQVVQTQALGTHSETARESAIEEAARLRAELFAAQAEKAEACGEGARLKAQLEDCRITLDRFKQATGKDLAALEAEKASKELLENRAKTQAELNAHLADQAALLKEQKDLAESRAEKSDSQIKLLEKQVGQLEKELAEAKQSLQEGNILRRKLHNTIQELRGNIRVFCRIRPAKDQESVQDPSGRALLTLTTCQDSGQQGLELFQPSKERETVHGFSFDRVFGPHTAQEDIFEELSHLVQSALDGYKVCCFAYGQTGSGKTHTMLGTEEDRGLIPRAMEQVFQTAHSMAGWQWDMKAAMLEVYNEEIHDLLGPGPPLGKKHVVSHDAEKGTTQVSHLQWVDVGHEKAVATLLAQAMDRRSTGSTAMNEQSSRSHFVFSLALEGTNAGAGQKVKGLLHLIDLAGSERLQRSKVAGERLKETQSINKSLSALGDVISSLANKESHVPFRNSKLTYLLQHSLSGSGKALMVVNVSPDLESLPETVSSLRFAAKVNACEIGTAKRHITMTGSSI